MSGIVIHKVRKHKQEKEQNFKGVLAAEAVKVCKLAGKSASRQAGDPMRWGGVEERLPIKISRYYYIRGRHNAKVRYKSEDCYKAFARYGTLRNVFDTKELPVKLKLRLYKAAVVCSSILTYGCGTWRITPPVM